MCMWFESGAVPDSDKLRFRLQDVRQWFESDVVPDRDKSGGRHIGY